MKLERVQLVPYTVELPAPIPAGPEPIERRHGVLLRLFADNGAVGVGEAAPLAGMSTEELDEAGAALATVGGVLSRALEAEGPPVQRIAAVVDDLRRRSRAAAFAAETAFLDLVGQAEGVPVARLLNPDAEPARPPVNALIPGDDPDQAVEYVRAGGDRGIRVFKAKIGRRGRFGREQKMLERVRSEFGDGVVLRADANGAWDPATALHRLGRLSDLGLEYCEQPVPIETLPEFTGSPVPFAADETVLLPWAIPALLRNPDCVALVLKPTVLGGMIRCLGIARRAAAAGRRCVVTHAFEGPVGTTAVAHLAAALPGEPTACGLDGHPAFAAWADAPPWLVTDGRLPPITGPGLGLPELEPPG